MRKIKPLDKLGLLQPPEDGPAILVYDIETAPALVWVWQQWDARVLGTKENWYMLCFVYKWLGQDDIGFVSLPMDPKHKPWSTNDLYVVERLAALFDRADITMGHNGDKFDTKKTQARMLVNDIEPPSPSQTIDTVKLARNRFAHMSNSLNDLGKLLDLGVKTQHSGMAMWFECMANDPEAWATMEEYNRQDVVLLEKLYYKLRPWAGAPGKAAFPNMAHWSEPGTLACTKCGSEDVHKRGTHRTSASTFQVIQCQSCGAYSRLRKRDPQTQETATQAV